MSRRSLGGGRVLGGGRSLGPATSKPPTPLPDHILSPSDSSISVNESGSGTSTPPSSDPRDIGARISLDNAATTLPLAPPAGNRLACPICSEEMLTLLQLNRHLDDTHKEIQEEQQVEVKDWFEQQIAKAKKFQPLAVLNQKLKGLDVFESNNELVRSTTPAPRRESLAPDSAAVRSASPAASKVVVPVDPDDVVSKQHWQRPSGRDLCAEPSCGRRLGATQYGIVNCRHCGKLFCEEHTMYQMKLSRSAQHEPVRGFWCRVCETCYKSREGYNDKHGHERDRLVEFKRSRQNTVGKKQMEVSRLEKRLSRLTQLLANPPEELPQPTERRWSLASWRQSDPKKLLEQSIVSWQNDAEVSRCPYCQQDFSQYTFRRHHCRTCGKVVCGDPITNCSTMLALNVATNKPPPQDSVALDIRLCKDCHHTLFSHSDFLASIDNPPPATTTFTRAYHHLLEFERGIRLLLPRFQKLLATLQDPESPPTPQQLTDASRTRKRLMDAFAQYDTAARRIRDMPSQNQTQLKLQKMIHMNASQFLHLHMLPLKSLPKVLKHATPTINGAAAGGGDITPRHNSPSTTAKPQNALSSIRYNHIRQDSSSALSISSVNSSRISELEAEEQQLRDRLIVLEEQRFMVTEMMNDATKRRKFDEVDALRGNVDDLSREIDSCQNLLDNLDFGEAYGASEVVRPGLGSGVNSPVRRVSGLTTAQSRNVIGVKDGGNG